MKFKTDVFTVHIEQKAEITEHKLENISTQHVMPTRPTNNNSKLLTNQ